MKRTGEDEQQRWAAMAEELAGVGYWWMEAGSERIRWSPNMFRIFGFEPGDEPPLDRAMSRVHPDDRAAADENLRLALSGRASAGAVRVIWPSGEMRFVEGRNAPEIGPDGRVGAVYGTLIDQTEHLKAESELAEARDAAQAAATVKADFLANMSHELRTPLTSVLGFSALLSERCALDDEARGYADRIAAASRALLATVNDILDFSKLEAGQVEIKPQAVDPAAACLEALGMFGVQAQAKGIALDFVPAPGLPEQVMIDPDRLRQILLNLIGNAVKFTETGAVGVELRYDAEAGALSATVRDSGPGMDAEQQARLFLRFSQIDAGSTRQHGGTGLGLAICKGLAEAMGGGVGVISRPGVGSAFSFHVRAEVVEIAAVADPATPAEAAAAAAVAGPPPGARLLIVDDHRVNRELARAMLSPWDLKIAEAEDGHAALAAAEASPFDLILMDVRMPGLDGPGAVLRIRAGKGPNRDTPILAFSADADGDSLHGLVDRGFDGVVSKPILAAELVAAVARWVKAERVVEARAVVGGG